MPSYRLGGRCAATDNASANDVVGVLWNPASPTPPLWVTNIRVCVAGATALPLRLQKSTAQGTAGSTVAAAVDNDTEKALAPPSGALLGLGPYSVLPTLDAALIGRFHVQNTAGAGVIMVFEERVKLEAGTGFAVAADTTGALSIPASDVSFDWEE